MGTHVGKDKSNFVGKTEGHAQPESALAARSSHPSQAPWEEGIKGNKIKPPKKLNFGCFPPDQSNLPMCARAIIPARGFLGLGANLDVIPQAQPGIRGYINVIS